MATVTEIWKCPSCGARVDIAPLGLYAEVQCPRCFHTARVHAQLGNFRLDSVLGIGGMSVVYRAFDVVLHRPLALKVLNDNFRDQPERIERFENESAMMARVRHENVTAVYSAGRAYDQFYIAMELVEGVNLEYMVTADNPIEPSQALEIIKQVALGLNAAHDAGLLHRDMKPGNVLITTEGKAKVIDFGLAIDSKEGDTEEIIWATPYYVPPETLQRKPEDVRTDIYALGMTLRYLLTGVEKFDREATSLQDLIQCKRKLQPLSQMCPHLLPSLCDLVDHMTEFSPSDRPKDYHDLLDEIGDVLTLLKEATAQSESVKSMLRVLPVGLSVAACAGLGALIALAFTPPAKEVRQKQLPLPPAQSRAMNTRDLGKALECLQDGNYGMAVKNLLETAHATDEATLGAWCAQLAKTLLAARVDDPNAEKEANQLLKMHLSRGASRASGAGQNVFHMLTEMDHGAYFNHRAWEEGVFDTPSVSKLELKNAIQKVVENKWHPVVKLMELFVLSEKAMWFGYSSLSRQCRSEMAKLNDFEDYGTLVNILSGGSVHRANGANRESRQKVEDAIRRMNYLDARDAFVALSQNPKLSDASREQNLVLSEACEVAHAMLETLKRKKPSGVLNNMSREELVQLAKGLSRASRSSVWVDGEQPENPVGNALDGNLNTRWCAADPYGGHVFVLDLDGEEGIRSILLDWEQDKEISLTVNLYSEGKVYTSGFRKEGKATEILVNDMPIDRIEILFEGGLYLGNWAGLVELKLKKKDGSVVSPPRNVGRNDFADELDAVLLMISGNQTGAAKKLQYIINREGDESTFSTIARDWLRRLSMGVTRQPVAGRSPVDTAADAIRFCQTSVQVRVLPDKKIVFEGDFPPLKPSDTMYCSRETAGMLQDRGLVEILPNERPIAMLGLLPQVYADVTLEPGKIIPLSGKLADAFLANNGGIILSSEKDAEAVQSQVDIDNLISDKMRRVVDLEASLK